MYPPPTRGSFSSRKRKIPGPIALLDNKSNQDHLESSWSSGGLNNQEDESAMEGVSQGADSAWWASGAWMSAWSVLGYPPMQEHPSEAHAAAMCEEYMGSPLRALAESLGARAQRSFSSSDWSCTSSHRQSNAQFLTIFEYLEIMLSIISVFYHGYHLLFLSRTAPCNWSTQPGAPKPTCTAM